MNHYDSNYTNNLDRDDEYWAYDDPDYDCRPTLCWCCLGEGGFHKCGEDCSPCTDTEHNIYCPECNGTGLI